jgi:hypothetical protein
MLYKLAQCKPNTPARCINKPPYCISKPLCCINVMYILIFNIVYKQTPPCCKKGCINKHPLLYKQAPVLYKKALVPYKQAVKRTPVLYKQVPVLYKQALVLHKQASRADPVLHKQALCISKAATKGFLASLSVHMCRASPSRVLFGTRPGLARYMLVSNWCFGGQAGLRSLVCLLPHWARIQKQGRHAISMTRSPTLL